MWSFDEAPGRDAAMPGNNQEGGNQWEASHNRRPLLGDPVKPCQRARAIVKGQTERENRWRAIDSDWRSFAEDIGARDAVRELSASFELLLRRCVQNRHHRGVKRIWEHHILCSWSVSFRHSVDFHECFYHCLHVMSSRGTTMGEKEWNCYWFFFSMLLHLVFWQFLQSSYYL